MHLWVTMCSHLKICFCMRSANTSEGRVSITQDPLHIHILVFFLNNWDIFPLPICVSSKSGRSGLFCWLLWIVNWAADQIFAPVSFLWTPQIWRIILSKCKMKSRPGQYLPLLGSLHVLINCWDRDWVDLLYSLKMTWCLLIFKVLKSLKKLWIYLQSTQAQFTRGDFYNGSAWKWELSRPYMSAYLPNSVHLLTKLSPYLAQQIHRQREHRTLG